MLTTFISWYLIGCLVNFLIIRSWNKRTIDRDKMPPGLLLFSWLSFIIILVWMIVTKHEEIIVFFVTNTSAKIYNGIVKINAWVNKLCNYK